MITNKLEVFNYDDDGNKTFRICLSKEDNCCDVEFCIEKLGHNDEGNSIVESTFQFTIYWGRVLRFVKSCFASHIK